MGGIRPRLARRQRVVLVLIVMGLIVKLILFRVASAQILASSAGQGPARVAIAQVSCYGVHRVEMAVSAIKPETASSEEVAGAVDAETVTAVIHALAIRV